MAKKSAASKGYRKTVKKKPFMTKKEIIACIVIVAAVVLGVVLFNLFYDDGTITEREVQENDILAYASSDVRNRYRRIGTANELEGFTREGSGGEYSSIINYYYYPEDEDSHIEYIDLGASFRSADDIINDNVASLSSYSFEPSEVLETTIQGHRALYYYCPNNFYDESRDPSAAESESTEAETAETTETESEAAETETETVETEEEPESNVYSMSISCYVDCGDNRTLSYSIYMTGEDDSYYPSEEEVLEMLQQYSDAFTIAEEA